MTSRTRRAAVLLGAATLALLAGATPASAHPLGNVTVNHYTGLDLHPDRVDVLAVEDVAEIPTLQRKPQIDANRDGALSGAEMAGYAARQCGRAAAGLQLRVDGRQLALAVTASSYGERPGAIRLPAGRLECRLRAAADLRRAAVVAVADTFDGSGIGWHEITALGTGVRLDGSPFPATSVSDALRRYPGDLLSSPLDVRGGTLRTSPGAGSSTYTTGRSVPGVGFATRHLAALSSSVDGLVGRDHLSFGICLLALLLSLLLGAGHACLPGHGKTVMAAYLVGRQGRVRDVVAVGATVTLTHTAGVLVLGGLLGVTTAFAPTAAEQLLGVVSGLLVAAVGVGLAASWWRSRSHGQEQVLGLAAVLPAAELVSSSARSAGTVRALAEPATRTAVAATPGHLHDHDHGHGHPHSHGHPHGRGQRRTGLVGLGIAGGLVPSPSALLVLLASIALGRTAFGVVLVLGYGVGMSAALCTAGLLLVRFRDRLTGRRLPGGLRGLLRVQPFLPLLTALLVVLVGLGLALRAFGGQV